MTVAHDDPRGLLALLTGRLGLSLSLAQQLVAEGSVFVDGRRATQAQAEVAAGQRLLVYVKDSPQPTLAPRIVYEDPDLLVVDKPAGLPCQPGRRGGASLLTVLPSPLWLPHRLDAETSGLSMLARSAEVCAKLGQALLQHRVTRTYAARVSGRTGERGQIDLRIGKAAGPALVKMRTYPADSPQGDPARTLFVRRAVFAAASGPESLLWLRLATGRTHQIRVHLAALGHPVVGDLLYGGQQAERLMLHAVELSLPHPRTGRRLTLSAALPPALWPGPAADLAQLTPEF